MKPISLALALLAFTQTANPPKPATPIDPNLLWDKNTWSTSANTIQRGSRVEFGDITMAGSLEVIGPTGDSLVKISLTNGTVTYGKTYTPDAAAKAFWNAIGTKYPCPRPAPPPAK